MKKIAFTIFLTSIILTVSSCSNSEEKEGAAVTSDTTKTGSANEKYVCPMDSDVMSDHPDTCVKCGMDLEKVN